MTADDTKRILRLLRDVLAPSRTGPGFTAEVLRKIREEDQSSSPAPAERLFRFLRDLDAPGRPGGPDLRELRRRARLHGLDLSDPAVLRRLREAAGPEPLGEEDLKSVAGGDAPGGDRVSAELRRLLRELNEARREPASGFPGTTPAGPTPGRRNQPGGSG
jgi:hypothetical protein